MLATESICRYLYGAFPILVQGILKAEISVDSLKENNVIMPLPYEAEN